MSSSVFSLWLHCCVGIVQFFCQVQSSLVVYIVVFKFPSFPFKFQCLVRSSLVVRVSLHRCVGILQFSRLVHYLVQSPLVVYIVVLEFSNFPVQFQCLIWSFLVVRVSLHRCVGNLQFSYPVLSRCLHCCVEILHFPRLVSVPNSILSCCES